jgi:hypothetical protein
MREPDGARWMGVQEGSGRMSDEITIRIPWIPPATLGANSHRHWRGKHPDEQAARFEAISATNKVLNKRRTRWECPDMPVAIVIFHWDKKSRRKDWDNAVSVVKHLQDGVCAALGIDDKRFITGMPFQKIDPDKQGYTEFIIRPATTQERRLAS